MDAASERADDALTREARFAGSLLGLALGDALGAPHEGGPGERLVWWMICLAQPGTLRYTDDTQMMMGMARSLIACDGFDADHMAQVWAKEASWSRGYGPAARKLLSMIRRGTPWCEANRMVHPDGSFGNGAAMRIAPIGLLYAGDVDRLDEVARESGMITHAHPLGWQGGVIIARAVAAALRGAEASEIIDSVRDRHYHEPYPEQLAAAAEAIATDRPPSPGQLATRFGHEITAQRSVITALLAACLHLHQSFDELIAFVIEVGGDVDTIGAMAGAIYGGSNGVDTLPGDALARLEDTDQIRELAAKLATLPGHR